MKKKVIAILLSVVLASGSIIPALAVETTAETAEEAVSVEEQVFEKTPDESEETTEETENAGTNKATEILLKGNASGEMEIVPDQELTEVAENGDTAMTESGAEEAAEEELEAEEAETGTTNNGVEEVTEEPETNKVETGTTEIGVEEVAEEALETDVAETGATEAVAEETVEEVIETKDAALADIQSGSYTYSKSGSNATITGYTGSASIINIPSTIDGYTVTEIGSGAFANNATITNVYIPSSVTKIGEDWNATGPFQNCIKLESVVFASGNSKFYIGFNAFYNCTSLYSVTIPGNCSIVYNSAFAGCTGLRTATFNSGIADLSIRDNAFSNCSSLTTVSTSSNIDSIGAFAFSNNYSLNNLTLAEGLTSIGGGAFYNCDSLETVTIPSTVTKIGYDWDGKGTFQDCAKLSTVTLETGYKDAYLGFNVFNNCDLIKTISIPGNYYCVADNAFRNCNALSFVRFEEGNPAVEIGDHAFRDCPNLGNVILSSNTNSIGRYAFYNDSNLGALTLKEGLTKISGGAFANCVKLTYVNIPSTVTMIGFDWDGEGAFQNCKTLSSIKFNEGTISARIGFNTFKDCDALTTVEIPGNYSIIDQYSFRDCSALTSVTYSASVYGDGNQSIRAHAFSDCPNLVEFTSSEQLANIDDYAFSNDSKLASIKLCEGLEKIGQGAFKSCSSLKYVTIPSTVSSIGPTYNGTGAFQGCTVLKGVIIEDSKVNGTGFLLGYNVFADCPRLMAVYIPASYTDIRYTSSWDSLSRLTIWGKWGSKAEDFADAHSIPFNGAKPSFPLPIITILSSDVTVLTTSCTYNSSAQKPSVNVVVNGCTLEKNIDYTVSYNNNVNVGTATVIVKGVDGYSGTVTKSFKINPKPVSNLTITGIAGKTYNSKAHTQAVVVKDGNTTLTNGTHYTITYKNNINAGTASVVIAGKGNYGGSVTKTFTISKAANSITAKNFKKTYSTRSQSFSLGAKAKAGTLTYSSNNKNVTVSKAGKVTIKAKYIGKAAITITAQNANYKKATKKITVTVNPTKTYISSLSSPAAGKMKVRWRRNSAVTGYVIQYSRSSKFTSPKNVWITRNTILTKTISSLSKGKKYYVRIRTYKKVGSVKFLSGWSATKTVTVKK